MHRDQGYVNILFCRRSQWTPQSPTSLLLACHSSHAGGFLAAPGRIIGFENEGLLIHILVNDLRKACIALAELMRARHDLIRQHNSTTTLEYTLYHQLSPSPMLGSSSKKVSDSFFTCKYEWTKPHTADERRTDCGASRKLRIQSLGSLQALV